MSPFLPLALLLAGAPAAPPGLVRALEHAPPGAARAVAATRALLGAPYVADPLGEGAGPDADPRFRLDAFDCMTFVETAVALGSSRTLGEAGRALDDVRYQGAPLRRNRHHEVLAQWLPANVARGYVAEATQAIAGERARREEKLFTVEGWSAVRRAGRAVSGLPREQEPLGRFGAWAVAPGDVAAIAGRIPDGALVFVIRSDDPLRPSRVTHAGLVVAAADGSRRVRHATSSKRFQQVIEESLQNFVRREEVAHPRWPVVGLTFYEVLDASAQVQGLGHASAAGGEDRVTPVPVPVPGR